jgi:molybdenum cofactor cytidylyltransferase
MSIGVIILAAGGSSRMGSPKQLLPYRGQSLVRHAARAALGSIADRVVVVIGGYADEVRNDLDGLPLSMVENHSWQAGMSSSIRAGLQELLSADQIDAVIITLCDQPFVTADVLNELVDTHRATGKPIIASRYGATRGVPALFTRELFSELMSLTADEGARRIISAHPEDVATISFAQGAVDIDTPLDHQRLTA